MLKRSRPCLRPDLGALRFQDGAIEGFDTLSPRERHVLEYLVAGYQTKQIMHELGITMSTAEAHRQTIKRKLGAQSHPHLVYKVLSSLIPRRP